MTGGNRTDGRDRWDLESAEADVLDRELDAALSKFAVVEPRAGLEDRVLANLRSQQVHATKGAWWRWPAAAALAAALVVSVFLAWKSERPVQKVASHPSATTRTNELAGTQGANQERGGAAQIYDTRSGKRLRRHAVSHSISPVPKLDQFPSPQPLSEQERILARYIANFPAHAALIAQARTEELRRDSAEEISEAASTSKGDSQ
jgi:hypothetical protein